MWVSILGLAALLTPPPRADLSSFSMFDPGVGIPWAHELAIAQTAASEAGQLLLELREEKGDTRYLERVNQVLEYELASEPACLPGGRAAWLPRRLPAAPRHPVPETLRAFLVKALNPPASQHLPLLFSTRFISLHTRAHFVLHQRAASLRAHSD